MSKCRGGSESTAGTGGGLRVVTLKEIQKKGKKMLAKKSK